MKTTKKNSFENWPLIQRRLIFANKIKRSNRRPPVMSDEDQRTLDAVIQAYKNAPKIGMYFKFINQVKISVTSNTQIL